ncbi:MAG TPA: glycosyltransferase family 39 protein [Pyrinomonadaceae bacterium]|nr:glycosyltransferase family 39 protein [Pyrinomonadaceae bacterium]
MECLRADMECLRADIECLHADIECLHPDIEGLRVDTECLHADIEGLHVDAGCLPLLAGLQHLYCPRIRLSSYTLAAFTPLTNARMTKLPPKKTNSGTKSGTLPLLAVAIFYTVARLWRLTASCLWFDEIFSVHAARHSWADMFRFVAADIIHPPLFYMLLKVWIGIGGESLLWLRLLPALLAIVAIIPIVLLCRELRLGPAAATFALLLMAVNGYLIKYAQELRMYSLLMLLSITSLWLFARVLLRRGESRVTEIGLIVTNFLLVYSHYAGWLFVLLEAALLFFLNRRIAKRFVAAVAITVLLCVPWIVLIFQNAQIAPGLKQNIGWMARPNVYDLIQFYSLLNKPFWFVQSSSARPHDLLTAGFALVLFGIPVTLLLHAVRKSTENDEGNREWRLLAIFTIAPIATAFVLSWILPQSVWGTRHLIVVAAPYSILVANAVARLPWIWFRTVIYAVAGSWFVLAAIGWVFSSQPVYIWCTWDSLARQVVAADSNSASVPIYAFEDLVAYHIWFANSLQQKHGIVRVAKNAAGVREDPAYFLPRRFEEVSTVNVDQIADNDFWIAYRAAAFDERQPPLLSFTSKGYEIVEREQQQAQGQQAFMVRLRRKL